MTNAPPLGAPRPYTAEPVSVAATVEEEADDIIDLDAPVASRRSSLESHDGARVEQSQSKHFAPFLPRPAPRIVLTQRATRLPLLFPSSNLSLDSLSAQRPHEPPFVPLEHGRVDREERCGLAPGCARPRARRVEGRREGDAGLDSQAVRAPVQEDIKRELRRDWLVALERWDSLRGRVLMCV